MKIEGRLMKNENVKNIIEETLKSLSEDALVSFVIESNVEEVEEIYKKLDNMIEKEIEKFTNEDKSNANKIWFDKLCDYCDSVQCSYCNFFLGCTKVQDIINTSEAPCHFTERERDILLEKSKEYSLEERLGKVPEIDEEY